MAAPFVQGRLKNEFLSVSIRTSCACCGEPMALRVDSRLDHSIDDPLAEPLIFHPQVDWVAFDEPNITHGF